MTQTLQILPPPPDPIHHAWDNELVRLQQDLQQHLVDAADALAHTAEDPVYHLRRMVTAATQAHTCAQVIATIGRLGPWAEIGTVSAELPETTKDTTG